MTRRFTRLPDTWPSCGIRGGRGAHKWCYARHVIYGFHSLITVSLCAPSKVQLKGIAPRRSEECRDGVWSLRGRLKQSTSLQNYTVLYQKTYYHTYFNQSYNVTTALISAKCNHTVIVSNSHLTVFSHSFTSLVSGSHKCILKGLWPYHRVCIQKLDGVAVKEPTYIRDHYQPLLMRRRNCSDTDRSQGKACTPQPLP